MARAVSAVGRLISLDYVCYSAHAWLKSASSGEWFVTRWVKRLTLLLLGCCIACGAPPKGSTPPHASATVPPGIPACTTAPGPAIPLTLHLGDHTQPLPTTLTTNVASAGQLIPVDGAGPQVAWNMLQQWNPPLIRLHLGFYGDGDIALPEGQQGVWNFDLLDSLISQLRARNMTFYLEIRTAPPWMFDPQGQLRDQSFQEFATYMARLVGWYNTGGFTDDQGQIHTSGHQGWVHTWEVWNEPNSGFEIPAPVANRPATWMPAARFAQLYDTATAAMRKVDPTIATGGPTITSYPDIPYLRNFIQNVHQPLNFLSLHYYAIGDQTLPDTAIFSAATGPRLLDRLVAANTILSQFKPGQHIPIWLDEVGVNEIAKPPSDPRGTSPLAYAFIAQVFALAATNNVSLMGQFPLVGSNQLALNDDQSHSRFRTFWLYYWIARLLPAGSLLLPLALPPGSGLVGLAAFTSDHHALRLILGNTVAAHPTDIAGTGVPLQVQLALLGFQPPTGGKSVATVWHFDASAPADQVPPPCAAALTMGEAGATVPITLGGYGTLMLDLPLA